MNSLDTLKVSSQIVEASLSDVMEKLQEAALDNVLAQCSTKRIESFMAHYGYDVSMGEVHGPYETYPVYFVDYEGRMMDEPFVYEDDAIAFVLEQIRSEYEASELTEVLLSSNLR